MIENYTFELIWPDGASAGGNPEVFMLTSTSQSHARREANDLWLEKKQALKFSPSGYRIRSVITNNIVFEWRYGDA